MGLNELILQIAFSQMGIREDIDEDRILSYFHEIGHNWVKTDDTAWCAAFVGWVLKNAHIDGTNKLNARSFLDLGKDVPLRKAQEGDLVVFWRGSKTSAQGHVGFYIGEDGNNIYVLGGNQGNKVCIDKYPLERLLSVRRLDW
jgi:uncharacterized protein (TIGR02594 family)